MKKNIIIAVSILVVGFIIGLLCRPKQYVETTIIERDTTFVVDTHIVEKPVPYKVTVTDTLLKEVTDTVRLNDTLYVRLPLEKREYRRDEFYAVVTGYEPRLTHIEVYPKTVYVTEVQKQIVRNKNYLSVGTEVGYVSSIHNYIYFEYDRMLHKNISLYGKFCYDLPTGYKGVVVGVKAQIGW